MLATIDGTQIGQALIGLVVILGFIANRYTVTKKADQVSRVATRKADEVAAVALEASNDQKAKIQEVHVLVNSQMSAALQRIDELEAALRASRIQTLTKASKINGLKTDNDPIEQALETLRKALEDKDS
jgi:hypothetical protein